MGCHRLSKLKKTKSILIGSKAKLDIISIILYFFRYEEKFTEKLIHNFEGLFSLSFIYGIIVVLFRRVIFNITLAFFHTLLNKSINV